MRGLLIAASLLAAGPAAADLGITGKPIDITQLGLRNGSVVSLKCDIGADGSWLQGRVTGQSVRSGTWGADIDTISRWRIEMNPATPTWFKMRALGQSAVSGPRYLSLRPKTSRTGPEPFLVDAANDVSSSFQLYYLTDAFGNAHFLGLVGVSAKPHPQSSPEWIKCNPADGSIFAETSLGSGNYGAWRIYIELPGK